MGGAEKYNMLLWSVNCRGYDEYGGIGQAPNRCSGRIAGKD